MKRLVYSSHGDYVKQFNDHYSKRDFHHRKIRDGQVTFTDNSVVRRLLDAFNKQYPDAQLELVSDYYKDENDYNINYWFVR